MRQLLIFDNVRADESLVRCGLTWDLGNYAIQIAMHYLGFLAPSYCVHIVNVIDSVDRTLKNAYKRCQFKYEEHNSNPNKLYSSKC